MSGRRFKRTTKLAAVILVLTILFSLATPGAAYSRGFLRGLVNFVVKLPDRITRPLGPLAPLAQIWLIGKVPKFGSLFTKARRIKTAVDDIDAQKKSLSEARAVYREQAGEFRRRAASIRAQKIEIRKILTTCGPGALTTYIKEYMELEKMAATLETAAARLEKRAGELSPRDVVKLFARNAIRSVMGDVKSVVIGDLTKDLEAFGSPRLVSGLIAHGGLNVDDTIGAIISEDLGKGAAARGLGGRLSGSIRKRVVARMREKLKDRRDYVKANWRQELDKALIEIVKKDAGATKELVRDIPENLQALNIRTSCEEESPEPADTGETETNETGGEGGSIGRRTFNLKLSLIPGLGPNMGLKLDRYKVTVSTIPEGPGVRVSGEFEITVNGRTERGRFVEQIESRVYPLGFARPMDAQYTDPIERKGDTYPDVFKGTIDSATSGSGTFQTYWGWYNWTVGE